MRKIITLFIIYVAFVHIAFAQSGEKRILIFSKTAAFRHKSIEHGAEVMKELLAKHHIISDHSEDADVFSDDQLSKYDAVLFLSTTGDIFNDSQKEAFQKFIRSGKGFVGIHAASDTEYHWPWYGQMVGGYFVSHPAVQEASIHVLNRKHPSTKHLPKEWKHKDEWYDFRDIQPDNKVLMKLDETSYKGGKMNGNHPIAWYKEFEGGRIFYTGLGHTDEAYDEPDFQQHVLGGLRYVLKIK
ncbi:ThuA domain-containing protein [Sphingobacterium spiritivorum]|uniref:ThuA domain-containing protein n=1 Tax=Sphingobacterium spiritivorum TaxID=258 RepID=UPI003DA56876